MMSDNEVRMIAARASRATPGPWYSHATDDEYASNALYVSSIPGTKERHDNRRGLSHGNAHQVPPEQVVAITLLQAPRLCQPDEYEENTDFIANARSDVPHLVEEVWRLRKRVAELERIVGGK
jgi:hypothetical protein